MIFVAYFEVPPLGGNKMMWLYLIKTKKEVFELFQRYKMLSGRSIKVLRTKGGDYTSNELEHGS
ncbi:hypothetical protein CR513_07017, partial [Mucuna pruriens]